MKINEETNKNDTSKSMKVFIDSVEFKSKVEKIIKDRIKNDKDLENKIVDITRNVLTQLYKTLWTRRNTWLNGLVNKKS